MAGKRKELSETQAEEIREEMKRTKNTQMYRRLLIIQAAGNLDRSYERIAKEYQVSKSTVSHQYSLYHREGLGGIQIKPKGGNHRNLSETEEKAILEGFCKRGEAGGMLEVAEIHAAYEAKVGRSISKSVVYYMLARHQWRKVMPRSQHPKRASVEEIAAYKKNH